LIHDFAGPFSSHKSRGLEEIWVAEKVPETSVRRRRLVLRR
jgi:hypothetical protein